MLSPTSSGFTGSPSCKILKSVPGSSRIILNGLVSRSLENLDVIVSGSINRKPRASASSFSKRKKDCKDESS